MHHSPNTTPLPPAYRPDIAGVPFNPGDTVYLLSQSGTISAHVIQRLNQRWLFTPGGVVQRTTGLVFSAASTAGISRGTAHRSPEAAQTYRDHTEAVDRIRLSLGVMLTLTPAEWSDAAARIMLTAIAECRLANQAGRDVVRVKEAQMLRL